MRTRQECLQYARFRKFRHFTFITTHSIFIGRGAMIPACTITPDRAMTRALPILVIQRTSQGCLRGCGTDRQQHVPSQ